MLMTKIFKISFIQVSSKVSSLRLFFDTRGSHFLFLHAVSEKHCIYSALMPPLSLNNTHCTFICIWKFLASLLFPVMQATALSTRWSLRIKGKVCCLGITWRSTITQRWRGCTLVRGSSPNIKMETRCGCMLASLLKCPTARTAWGEGVEMLMKSCFSWERRINDRKK